MKATSSTDEGDRLDRTSVQFRNANVPMAGACIVKRTLVTTAPFGNHGSHSK